MIIQSTKIQLMAHLAVRQFYLAPEQPGLLYREILSQKTNKKGTSKSGRGFPLMSKIYRH